MYKYKINYLIDQLTYDQHRILMKTLPKVLRISKGTLINYKKIKIEDNQDIPHQIVKALEIIFSLPHNGLSNLPVAIEVKPLIQLVKEEKKRLAEEKLSSSNKLFK